MVIYLHLGSVFGCSCKFEQRIVDFEELINNKPSVMTKLTCILIYDRWEWLHYE